MKKRKIVGSAILGNIVEYYDFGIYAVFAPTIGRVFFPDQDDKVMQTLLAFMVFAVGFLMRPMGGFVFGHIGDRFGRKVSLTISILGMA
jgi:MFS transporter, MHS family, proline/betaine transporter